MFNIKDQYILGDCLDIMPLLPDHCIDVVISDPPNLILNKHYSTRKWFRRSFGDLGIVEHFFRKFFRELERIIKSTGFIYLFCNDDSYPFFWYYLYPFTKNVRQLIWDKIFSYNGYGWRHQHEIILYAEMPNSPIIRTGDGDILKQRAVKVDDREHPAEKPVELIEKILLKSSKKGDIIADFFSGNATILKMAKMHERYYFGCEYDKNYYKKGMKELIKPFTHNLDNFIKEV